MEHPRVAIVVPCYKEAARLPTDAFQSFLRDGAADFIFVDDGSPDRTFEVLESLRAACPGRVTVLRQNPNRGKAEAVRRGINHALEEKFDYAGFWDADLATPLSEISYFLQVFAEHPALDMVFGSRIKLLGRQVERKASRHYLGRVSATIISTVLGLPIYDTQCGAKIFKMGPRTAPLFAQPFLSRWIFDVEILARYLAKVGHTRAIAGIYEFPLHSWVDVGGSKLKATDFLFALRDLARIRRAYLRQAPKE